eukprot:1624338-Pyramimonas_sp.AAC.1
MLTESQPQAGGQVEGLKTSRTSKYNQVAVDENDQRLSPKSGSRRGRAPSRRDWTNCRRNAIVKV